MTQTRVQSVDRALGLLWVIHRTPGLTLTGLATAVKLLPSTTSRLLATLEQHDLVQRESATRGYHLGSGISALAGSANIAHEHIRDVLQTKLETLAHTVHEQAAIGVLDGHSQVNIAIVDGASAAGEDVILRPTGATRHSNLNATAIGKVLLAYSPSRAEDLIDQLNFDRTAKRTITTAAQLRRQLVVVRRNGFATSVDENSPHVSGIAAPLRDGTGEVIAALSINGPAARLPRTRLQQLLPLLRQMAHESSGMLGFRTQRGSTANH